MVTALALVSRLVLAVVFAVAGGAKLKDRRGTRRNRHRLRRAAEARRAAGDRHPARRADRRMSARPSGDRLRRGDRRARAAPDLQRRDRLQSRARPSARMPLLRPAPLGADRLEDARPKRRSGRDRAPGPGRQPDGPELERGRRARRRGHSRPGDDRARRDLDRGSGRQCLRRAVAAALVRARARPARAARGRGRGGGHRAGRRRRANQPSASSRAPRRRRSASRHSTERP